MATSEELASLVFSTSRLLREQAGKTHDIDPFSQIRYEALNFIAEKKSPTMKALAAYFSVQPPTTTTLINSLVSLGHVSRTGDTKDRRIIRLSITPKGREALKQGNKRKLEHIKIKFSPLNAKERADLARILRKMARYYQEK